MNSDFRDLLAALNDEAAEYLVVGAHALAAHGHIRATNELDVWGRPCEQNAQSVFRTLRAFGAPLHDLTQDDLAHPGIVFQIGVAPIRIDIITAIDGVGFDEAWDARVPVHLGDIAVHVLSRHHLIQNKRASGRLQDLADVERLEGGSE